MNLCTDGMKQFSKRLSLFYDRLHSDEFKALIARRGTTIFLAKIVTKIVNRERHPQFWDANNVTGRVNSIADRIIYTILGVLLIPPGVVEGLIDCSISLIDRVVSVVNGRPTNTLDPLDILNATIYWVVMRRLTLNVFINFVASCCLITNVNFSDSANVNDDY